MISKELSANGCRCYACCMFDAVKRIIITCCSYAAKSYEQESFYGWYLSYTIHRSLSYTASLKFVNGRFSLG